MAWTGDAVDLEAVPPPPEWGVGVDTAAVERLADAWRAQPLARPRFDYDGLPDWSGEPWVTFAALSVSVVACLWPPEREDEWSVELAGRRLADAPAVFACFTRAGPAGHDPGWFGGWDGPAEAGRFFAGRGTLQLVTERGERLKGVGRALQDRWEGSGAALLEEAGWDGPRAVELLVETVPGYRDRVATELGELRFDKLARLCVAMMATRSPRAVERLDRFPVYPDYMLPRVLRHHGLLVYAPALGEAVDRRREIPRHSRWELALRWATVHAAERLRAALGERGNRVSSPELDYHLWWSAVLGPDAGGMGEHHRTITLSY